jgi:L-asparaginase
VSDPVQLVGRIGAADPALFVLYTGGTIGMQRDASGSLRPLPLVELRDHLPALDRLGVGMTVATFPEPIDSSRMTHHDWEAIADALVAHLPGHVGAVVLHGTDTMAYTASALSFVLEGLTVPVVLTGAQRPLTEVRTDGRENLITACEIAAASAVGLPVVPEVTVFFDDVLLRGNRSMKVHADSYRGFASPNLAPLATSGVTIDIDVRLVRPAGAGPLRRVSGFSSDVAAVRLHPAVDRAALDAALSRSGLRGVVIEAYGAGNGPSDPWFVDCIGAATARGVTVVVVTQCRAGTVDPTIYATGAALDAAGATPGADLTFEAALTKLMAGLARFDGADDVRSWMTTDIAGELTADAP